MSWGGRYEFWLLINWICSYEHGFYCRLLSTSLEYVFNLSFLRLSLVLRDVGRILRQPRNVSPWFSLHNAKHGELGFLFVLLFSRELWDFRNVVFLCLCIPTNWYPPTLHLHSHCYTGSAGQNKQHLVTKNTAKLDRETEELHHDRVTLEVGKVIQKGRQDKGLTQKDLATVSVKTVGRFCGWCGDLFVVDPEFQCR